MHQLLEIVWEACGCDCCTLVSQGWQQQLAPHANLVGKGNGFAEGKPQTHHQQAGKEYGADLPFVFMPADRSADDIVLALCGQAVNGAMPADDRQDISTVTLRACTASIT